MSPIHVLDDSYLGITILISLAIQSLAFIVAYTLQFDKITDFSGGTNFFILALITLIYGQSFQSRNWIASLAVMLWALRLAAFLLFRVLKRGKDDRFDEMRSNFIKFGTFWMFQLIWVWVVSLPITVLNSPNISDAGPVPIPIPFGSASDIIGLIFFLVGMVLETLADIQKYQWKSRSSKADSQDQLPVCRIGVWKWSRHPNYFGEILLWWGIWFMVIESAKNPNVEASSKRLLYATVVSPIFITILLLFLSGLPTAEKPVQKNAFIKSHKAKLDKNIPPNDASSPPSSPSKVNHQDQPDLWSQYQVYLDQTSILFPIPSQVYRFIPPFIKHSFLLDWSIYRFDPNSNEAQLIIQAIKDEAPSSS